MIELAGLRLVTTELLGDSYPPRQWKGDRKFLSHVAVLNDAGAIERALCGQVKRENLSDDGYHWSDAAPSCPKCARRLQKLKESPCPEKPTTP